MKAMIFAAGLGTRLAPLTDTCPKALIEVGGQTMLERVIKRLRDAGVEHMVVNVHHYADMIERYLAENDNFGVDIAVSSERGLLLDTGGGVVRAIPLLTAADPAEPIMLYNADILSDFPIAEMLGQHEATGADATLLVSATRKSTRGLLFTPEGRMAGWANLATGEVRAPGPFTTSCKCLAFGGVHIISPHILSAMAGYGSAHGEVFSITPFYTDLCDLLDIRAYIPSEPYRWIDIGRPATLAKAREMF